MRRGNPGLRRGLRDPKEGQDPAPPSFLLLKPLNSLRSFVREDHGGSIVRELRGGAQWGSTVRELEPWPQDPWSWRVSVCDMEAKSPEHREPAPLTSSSPRNPGGLPATPEGWRFGTGRDRRPWRLRGRDLGGTILSIPFEYLEVRRGHTHRSKVRGLVSALNPVS